MRINIAHLLFIFFNECPKKTKKRMRKTVSWEFQLIPPKFLRYRHHAGDTNRLYFILSQLQPFGIGIITSILQIRKQRIKQKLRNLAKIKQNWHPEYFNLRLILSYHTFSQLKMISPMTCSVRSQLSCVKWVLFPLNKSLSL